MKILISTLGSRGDTQPYLALAVGLQQAGHRVTLVAPHSFIEWIQSYGVNAHPVRFNPHEVMQTLSKSKNPFQAMRLSCKRFSLARSRGRLGRKNPRRKRDRPRRRGD